MALDPYGTGLATLFGLPLRFTFASGLRNLGNNLARRLQTPRGSLPWDLNCGYDVRGLLRSTLTRFQVSAMQNAISSECEKDPRVASASTAAVFADDRLQITVTVTGSDGNNFDFIFAVDALSVSLLRIVPE